MRLTGRTEAERREERRRILQATRWAETHRLPKDILQRLELWPGMSVGDVLDQIDKQKGNP